MSFSRTAFRQIPWTPFVLATLALPIQSQAPSRAVFLHGAGAAGEWATAMSQLGSSFPSFPMSGPSLPQSLSLANQASTLSLTVMDGQSVLIGHSNGGLVSRYARANIGSGARSIITVGTPNAGVPMLFQSNWLAVQSGLIVFEIVEVGTMWILDAWDMYATEYWSAVATAGAIFGYTYAIDYAHDYISSFSAFLGDDLPGSTFLSGLPSAGSNSFSLNVTLGAGAGGGPIALVESPSAADNWGAGLFAAGALLEFYAYQAQFEIDYTRPDWYFALLRLVSAQSLANRAMNFPYLWCLVVNYPTACAAHDGLVPVSSQSYPGALNTALTGPAHTKQAFDSSVINFIRLRLIDLGV